MLRISFMPYEQQKWSLSVRRSNEKLFFNILESK